MSAYRELTGHDLEHLRVAAGADAVADCRPITAGIENSNWFLTLIFGTRRLACVLTLVEAVPPEELPFFIALTDTLAEADLPVPMALRLADGHRELVLQGKAALLVPQLPGEHLHDVDADSCRAVGSMLARLHHAARRCPLSRNRPDHQWWPTAFSWVAGDLPRAEHDELAAALLAGAQAFSRARDRAHPLPQGLIHGDLFRDNVLMQGNEVSGVLDFFHATHDLLAWDIAIALNDWAVTDGGPDHALAAAFLAGYEALRPLTARERELLPVLRRTAAARFWLSRLVAARRQAGLAGPVQRKDPGDMRALLRALPDQA